MRLPDATNKRPLSSNARPTGASGRRPITMVRRFVRRSTRSTRRKVRSPTRSALPSGVSASGPGVPRTGCGLDGFLGGAAVPAPPHATSAAASANATIADFLTTGDTPLAGGRSPAAVQRARQLQASFLVEVRLEPVDHVSVAPGEHVPRKRALVPVVRGRIGRFGGVEPYEVRAPGDPEPLFVAHADSFSGRL